MVCWWNRSCDSSTADLISNLFLVTVSSGSCHFIVFVKILACDWTIGNSSAIKLQILLEIQFVDSDVVLSRHKILFCSRSAAAFLRIESQCTRTFMKPAPMNRTVKLSNSFLPFFIIFCPQSCSKHVQYFHQFLSLT